LALTTTPHTQWITTILITIVWVISVSGWSLARRQFNITVPESNAKLG
jgi:hypothetical protein